MNISFVREFKLAGPRGDGRHAYLNENGAYIGRGVPLLEKDVFGRWKPRDKLLLESLFAKGYGNAVDLGSRVRQLGYVARAMSMGDFGRASVALVRMELPPLPDAESARRMAAADGLLTKYNPDWDDEPRVPMGDPSGGEWTGGDGSQATAASRSSKRGMARGKDVIIDLDDGSTETTSGGSRARRNNNPGNIAGGQWANDHGGIGSAGGFAIFPDETTGEAAQRSLLNSPPYSSMTIDDAVALWAPPGENQTATYQSLVREWTGLPGNVRIDDLNSTEIAAVMAAQRRMEVWQAGTVTRSGP